MIIPYRTFPGDKRLVYRPIIEVKLKLNHKTIPIWAVIDSGADKTMINKKLGERLGYDFVTNQLRQPEAYQGNRKTFGIQSLT